MKCFNVSIMFILPNAELSSIEHKLNEIDFNDLSERLYIDIIDVKIPKFKMEFSVDLKNPLEEVIFLII